MDYKYFICAETWLETKHKISIKAKVNKHRRIRTKIVNFLTLHIKMVRLTQLQLMNSSLKLILI